MRKFRTAGRVAGLVALAALAQPVWAQCTPGTLDLKGPRGTARFTVELARTEADRAHGLMDRAAMATSAGMLFVYESPRRVAFWMKDTLIPLDMIFADGAGRVTRVKSNAVPGDLTPIDGGPGVQYVLEINGGLAGRLGIREGAVIRHPVIDRARAAWPCP